MILDAARACFLEHGPAVPTQTIADALGLSQAALFKRFGTKLDLMKAALTPNDPPPWLDLLEQGPDDRPIEVQLHGFAVQMILYFDRMLPCHAVMRAAGVDPVPQWRTDAEEAVPLRNHRALARWISVAVAQGRVRAVDPDAVASMFLGAIHSRSFLQHFFHADLGGTEDHVRQLIEVLWTGIRPDSGPVGER